jgi:chromosome segregation ATPase
VINWAQQENHVPTLEDIFTDGPEHLSRSLRRAGLRRRLRREEEQGDELLTSLGERAWRLELPAALESSFSVEIQKLAGEIEELRSDGARRIADLQAQVDRERIQRDEVDSGDSSQACRLEELEPIRDRLKMELDTLDIELRRAQSAKDTLRSELDTLVKEGRFLELSPEAPDSRMAPQENVQRRESVELELSGADRSIIDARRAVEAKRAELEPVAEEIFALEAEINRIRLSHQRYLEKVEALEKQKQEIETAIRRSVAQRETRLRTLFRDLGAAILPHRPEHRDLESLYVEADLNSTTRDTIASSMKSESALIDLLDRQAVLFFYWIAGGCAILVTFLVVFLAIVFSSPRPF